MREDGSPVLLDFGSARQRSSDLTSVVSPGFAPFEQYHAQGKQGPWSDLPEFLAAIGWALHPLEGQRPQSVAEWRHALLSAKPVEAQTKKAAPAEAAG